MKKVFAILLSCLMLITAVTGCSQKPAEANKVKKIVIRYNSTLGDAVFKTSPSGMAIKKFIDDVQAKSNGRIEVKLFTGGQLGSTSEQVIGGLQNGAFDMTDWSLGAFGEYTKAFMPFNMAYLFANADQAHKFINGPVGKTMNDMLLKDTKIRALAYMDMGFREVTNNVRPIKSPADLKGLKIRTQSDPYQVTAFKVLGANPTPIAFSELYTALQQKVVDGQENPAQLINNNKFYEVQKYMSLTQHIFGSLGMIMSDQFYQSLPQDMQKIVTDCAADAQQYCWDEFAKKDADVMKQLSSKIQITELTSEQLKAFQDVEKEQAWPQIKKDIGDAFYNQIIDEITKIQNTK